MPSNTPPSTRTTRGHSLDSLKSLIKTSESEIISTLKDDIVSLRTVIASLTERVLKLEQENKQLSTQYENLKKDKVQSTSAIEELEERSIRRQNLIVSGVPEASTGSLEVRRKYDENEVVKVMNYLNLPVDHIKSLNRIDAKREGRPRL